jgi:hypothetical protein
MLFSLSYVGSFIEEYYSYHEKYQKYCFCKIEGTLEGRRINAEFSLQTPSQNSRENIQRQCWSKIREL